MQNWCVGGFVFIKFDDLILKHGDIDLLYKKHIIKI